MTIQDEYVNATLRSQDAWLTATESFTSNITQNLAKATEQARISFAPVAPVDATAAVEQWFGFAGRLLEVNREYARNLAGVSNAFTGAVRKHVDSIGEVVRDQAQAVTDTAREQAERIGQVERDLARQAAQAERAQARQERQAARERYEGLTKAELSEQLGNRDLPKTGNVEELVERLVDADTQR